MDTDAILTATQSLQRYIESHDYKGYDPYDALKSPLFKAPFFRTKFVRFAAQQTVKRSPLNLRTILSVDKGYNPVTLGLCLQAYTDLIKVYPQDESLITKIRFLVDELEKFIPNGFHGACWGYDFDWQARHASIPASQPTVVATGIITNALFNAYREAGMAKAFDLCESSCDFILKDLNRTVDSENNFCFSYSPFDRQVVFNASMKGARTLAQVFSVTKNEMLNEEARRAAQFVVNHQRADGAWAYSTASTGRRIDNYHTGYVLDCLHEYFIRTGDTNYIEHLERGFEFYKNNFFKNNFVPKFYHNHTYPIDSTAAAQSLLTLCRFGETEMAKQVAGWMIENMQDSTGYFYFRRYQWYTNKISFMRWSNAWMFAGLSNLLRNLNSE